MQANQAAPGACSDDGLPDTRPPLLVTASVDAINLRHPLSMDNDMAVSGRVVWTGKSALDIQMELTQARAQRARLHLQPPHGGGPSSTPCQRNTLSEEGRGLARRAAAAGRDYMRDGLFACGRSGEGG